MIAIQPIGWAIPIAFLVKQHLLESYVIASDSMSPTLFLNDRILVDKRAAGEMSFDRWDVVVFRNPEERKQYHVKRIIGLPGETIKVDEQGKMTIDGKPHDSRHLGTVHIGDVLGPISFILMPSESWSRFEP